MKTPATLYRFRPLEEALLERELAALRDSYLYAPPFAAMNDPMEAFYETGSPKDQVIDALIMPVGKSVASLYKMLADEMDHFALVSFAGTYEDLPMWAYYGSNFAGMCLEFDSATLTIGDFDGEKLLPVTYARRPLPPITLADLTLERMEEAVVSRISRKRSEWAHEKEWRFLTGEIGPRHYLDNALRRVFLGPRVDPEHARRVCEVLDHRPVEVLQGEVHGFELGFRSIKPARSYDECERVGSGTIAIGVFPAHRAELEGFLSVPFERLEDHWRDLVRHPNLERIDDFDVSGTHRNALFVSEIYKLRNGREVYRKSYFDRQMRPLALPR